MTGLPLVALVLGLAMLAAACAADERTPDTGIVPVAPTGASPSASSEVAGARATRPEVTPTLPLAGETAAAPPQIIVSDQSVRDGRIVVEQAIVPEDGWVVIHETLGDGAPGAVIGSARLDTRLNLQIPVQLDRPFDEPTQLVAMLHRNTGDPESFSYPETDPPFVENGRPVIDRFTVRPSS